MTGDTTEGEPSVNEERVYLIRAAMLAREGNGAAALEVLRDAAEKFIGRIDKANVGAKLIGPRRGDQTNPLYLPLSELGIDTRILGFLEQTLNAVYVIDLDRWTPEQIKAVPNLGPKGYEHLIQRLKAAGVLKALADRKKLHRKSPKDDEKIPVDGSQR